MNSKINYILKYLALALIIGMMGCSSKDEPDNGVKGDEEPEAVEAVPEMDGYVAEADAGVISIPVKANGTLTANVYPSDCDWMKITDVAKVDSEEDAWILTLTVNRNTGLGRIAAVDLKVNGMSPMVCRNPYIVQQPAPFGEEVTIEAPEAGRLQILLGDGTKNLRRIRQLAVKGDINAIDLAELKKLLVISKSPDHDSPISLDLSDCAIIHGCLNPFEAYRWNPRGLDDLPETFPDEIPHAFFRDAVNLVHIDLPKNLKAIDPTAFSGCSGLESIDIPSTVQSIGSQTFWKCPNLTEINIPTNSELTTLGNEAFATNSVISSLSFPECLTDISASALAFCKVTRLHLHWTNPLPLKFVPQTEGCTLYVPKGTADSYRSTPNWSSFEHIIEE
ncbi:MAG: leucine-rich repeat protein [Muribaculaceae bacterium]|nr:leucine-rich repeat protein [Muribaculaceae bacterium]